MAASFVLVLDAPNGDAARKIGGLSLALRLALDARAAGARAICLAPGAESVRPLLSDARLPIPIVTEPSPGENTLRVPASYCTHRAVQKALRQKNPDRNIDLTRDRIALEVAYAFDPIDVVDDASARRAERLLFRSLRKREDGWTSRWLNRYISLAISRQLVKTPLKPNQISIVILGVGLLGAWLASRGTPLLMALGAFLFQAQSVLDGCDGEMSRVTYRGSLLGEWLDTIGDDLTNYGFFAGAAWGLHVASGRMLYLVAGAVTVASGLVASAIEYRYLIRIGSGDLLKYPIKAASGDAGGGGFFSAIQPLFKRDTFVFLTFLAALVGALGPMLVLFSLGAVGILINVFAAELRMARERRRAPKHEVED